MTTLEGRSVVVTGADGFIGSHLVEQLVETGASVRALCVYNSNGSLGWLDELSTEYREAVDVWLGDVRDAEFVRALIAGTDTVFHLAALVAIPYSYQAPRSFVDTNVTGTLNVLEAARHTGIRCLVHTSTSEVYGTPDSVPITEGHALKGQSPYSASKIAADKLAESYARSFELPVMTLRPFNTYGPRQSLRAVIPTILAQLLAGVDSLRLGALSPSRDFTFVEDTVDGFLRAATAELEHGEVVHLGTGETITIGALAELCMAVVGHEAAIETDQNRLRPAASEVDVLLSDPSRARARLGWQPRVSLRSGLERLASWLDGRIEPHRATDYHR